MSRKGKKKISGPFDGLPSAESIGGSWGGPSMVLLGKNSLRGNHRGLKMFLGFLAVAGIGTGAYFAPAAINNIRNHDEVGQPQLNPKRQESGAPQRVLSEGKFASVDGTKTVENAFWWDIDPMGTIYLADGTNTVIGIRVNLGFSPPKLKELDPTLTRYTAGQYNADINALGPGPCARDLGRVVTEGLAHKQGIATATVLATALENVENAFAVAPFQPSVPDTPIINVVPYYTDDRGSTFIMGCDPPAIDPTASPTTIGAG